MEKPASLPGSDTLLRRLRLYRWLANVFVVLLAFALVLLLFRWLFPWTFALLVFLWTTDAIVLAVLSIPWLLIASTLALGRIACPACHAPFTSRFHLWVPKNCQTCGYDITAPAKSVAGGDRLRGS